MTPKTITRIAGSTLVAVGSLGQFFGYNEGFHISTQIGMFGAAIFTLGETYL